jgi:hypothetical protein
MEALDRALERMEKRADAFSPVVVRNATDIRRLLIELDPDRNPQAKVVDLHTKVEAIDNGQRVVYDVSAPTRSLSKRDQLIAGMEVVKKRLEALENNNPTAIKINGRDMFPAKLGYDLDGFAWVDPLIKRWLGAYRRGLMICWDLSDGYNYQYDIFNHKLSRSANASSSPSVT